MLLIVTLCVPYAEQSDPETIEVVLVAMYPALHAPVVQVTGLLKIAASCANAAELAIENTIATTNRVFWFMRMCFS
ncbi:MAG: hypothetical protein Q8L45_03320 [Xanthomonadaceae bacterium]|nr:hypothetical protein [Xanthomonadaceae bacterium]MDZ4117182.1 hypothetical protein [Xanthomonadaceae bacterium]